MSNSEVRKYLNSLPRYIPGDTNYQIWKMGLGPNVWHYGGAEDYPPPHDDHERPKKKTKKRRYTTSNGRKIFR